MKSKIAIVTGASSGIGEAIAELLAKSGYQVYGTSRKTEPATQHSYKMIALDVNSEPSIEAALKEIIRIEGRIDLVVNNVIPAPYMATYAATKHAIEGYSESLDHELRTRGIRVSVVEPGYTNTSFEANTQEVDSKLEEYAIARKALAKLMKIAIAGGDDPKVVADVVLKAVKAKHPKLRYAAGKVASRLSLLRRFAPAALLDIGIRKELKLDSLVTIANQA